MNETVRPAFTEYQYSTRRKVSGEVRTVIAGTASMSAEKKLYKHGMRRMEAENDISRVFE